MKMAQKPEDYVVAEAEFGADLGVEKFLHISFLVVLIGDVMTMLGLPKQPAALQMDVDEYGNTRGLF